MAASPSTIISASMQANTAATDPGSTETAISNETRDDDDISLTSTVDSEPQDEYEVETIYAEEKRYGIRTYLVKWKGYSDLRCTWEPVSSFNGFECLKEWKRKQQAIKQGLEQPFDVPAWEARLEAFLIARDERKRRRRQKRARLGLPPSSNEVDEQERATPETDDEAEHQPSESDKDFTSDSGISLVRKRAQRDVAPLHSTTSRKMTRPISRTNSTSSSAVRRIERPRLPAPDPVPITVTNDRTRRRSLPNILNRAKEKPKPSADGSKIWKLYSTTNKFNKATRYDHEPIREELELQKPGEWTPFQMSSYIRKKPNTTNDTNDTNDSLFVEQDDNDMSLDSHSTPLRHSMTQKHGLPGVDNAAPNRQLQEPLVGSSPKKPVRFLSKPPTGPRSLVSPKTPFRVRSRELAKKSDLLCQLSYGPNEVEVGEISLCDISDSARRTLYATKQNHVIHIAFDEFCSLNDYHAITRETGNDIQFNGCITAFSDTQAKLTKFEEHLLANELVAVSRIPNLFYPQYSFTLLCYPAQSRDFQFLNRYSYVAPEDSLRIAGTIGLLPRLSQINSSRNPARRSERISNSRLERPERQGRFHEQSPSGKDDVISHKRSSDPALSVPLADTQSFSTISTPNPLKVRKVSKTPIPSTKQPSGKGVETASKSDFVIDDDIGPSIPRKLQLNIAMATESHLDGNAPSASSESMDISPLTPSASKNGPVNLVPGSTSRKLSSAGPSPRDSERQVIMPTTPEKAAAVKRGFEIMPIRSVSANTDEMDFTSSPVSSKKVLQSTTEVSLSEQQKDNTGGRSDVDMLDINTMGEVDVKEYVKKVFPHIFKLDFSNLAAITTYGRSKATNCFYLCFPEEADADFQILEHYLDSHLAIVLSSRRANDWEKFTKSQSGVALFHHSFMRYYALPGLYRLTRNTSFNFWNVSLSTKIPGLGHDSHFQRIFPNGAGFLMTEDFMLHEHDATIIILGWFREQTRSKLPGSYRMMFRPNIMNWLDTMSEKDPRFTVMAVLIGDIASRGDPSNWPVEPRDLDQFADPLLETPAVSLQSMPRHSSPNNNPDEDSIKQRNGDYLCEIFSAWALLNIASMRRFCILTHDEPREPWRSWTHIEISRDPVEFYQKWGINKDLYTKWLAQDTSQAMSTESPAESR